MLNQISSVKRYLMSAKQESDLKAGTINLIETLPTDDLSTYFMATRDSKFSGVGTTITYEKIQRSATGAAMDENTGVFTVPAEGKYRFIFTGLTANKNTVVNIRLNGGAKILTSSSYLAARQDADDGGSLVFASTANLKKDDKVDVFLQEGELKLVSTFAGFMIPTKASVSSPIASDAMGRRPSSLTGRRASPASRRTPSD